LCDEDTPDEHVLIDPKMEAEYVPKRYVWQKEPKIQANQVAKEPMRRQVRVAPNVPAHLVEPKR